MKTKLFMFALATLGFFACTPKNSPNEPSDSDNPIAINGTLPGKFTINAQGDQVQFSQGNLQYQASTNTWRFAPQQYYYVGKKNKNINKNYSGWIDLFGWGTGNNPTRSSENNSDYQDFADWGLNNITNGGKNNLSWRTMNGWELEFLLEDRSQAQDLCGNATVNGVQGLIILPDNWTTPAGLTWLGGPENDYKTNKYSSTAWSKMEEAGAVFLPAAGQRWGTNTVFFEGLCGWYWTSTYRISEWGINWDWAEDLSISDSHLEIGNRGDELWRGQSVRLVRNVEE